MDTRTFTFITLPSPTGGRGERLWLDEDALSEGDIRGYEWGEKIDAAYRSIA